MHAKTIMALGACCVGIIILFLISYGVIIEPYNIEIHHVYIHDSSLHRILKDEIIVQLYDLHIGSLGKREQEVLDILEQLRPDIIFLTGDYVAWKGRLSTCLEFSLQTACKNRHLGDYGRL